MKNSIKKELTQYAQDFIKERTQYDSSYMAKDISDIHYEMFNEDYYIIGYHQAEEWLKKHDLNTFEAIEICNYHEEMECGTIYTKFDNAEQLVNILVYWLGEEVLQEII